MLKWIRDKLRLTRLDSSIEDCPSVVILLKEPQIRTPEESLNIVRNALGANTDVELIQTLNDGCTHVIRDGKFLFSFHQYQQRYKVPGRPSAVLLQKPWEEHKAWLAFDLPTQSSVKLKEIDSLGLSYKVLLVFAFLSWSPNCLAVYFPAEAVTVPNLGDLADSIHWARRNGLNLDFLNTTKATSS